MYVTVYQNKFKRDTHALYRFVVRIFTDQTPVTLFMFRSKYI